MAGDIKSNCTEPESQETPANQASQGRTGESRKTDGELMAKREFINNTKHTGNSAHIKTEDTAGKVTGDSVSRWRRQSR